MRPLFSYLGTKSMLASKIVPLLPAHHHYVEVCGGSLAILLAKPEAAAETVNDIDGELVNFWKCLRDYPDELIRRCLLTPHSRTEYYSAIETRCDTDSLEMARRTWVKLAQGSNRTTQTPVQTMWVKRLTTKSYPDALETKISRFAEVSQRIHHVSLDQRSAVEMVKMYGRHASTLLYIDPPYPGRGDRYSYDMDTAAHEELITQLLSTTSSVAVSGYPGTIYDDALTGWDRHELTSKARTGVTNLSARTEILWVKHAD